MQLLLRPVLFTGLLFLVETFATPVCTRAGTGSGQVFSSSDSNSGFCNVGKVPANNSPSIHARALDGRKEVIETHLTLRTPQWPDDSNIISEDFAVKIYNATQTILPLLVPVHPTPEFLNLPKNLAFKVTKLLYCGKSGTEQFMLTVFLHHNDEVISTRIHFDQRTFKSQSLRAGDLFGYVECYHDHLPEACFKFRNGFYEDSGMEFMKRFPKLEITKVTAVKASKPSNYIEFTFKDTKSGQSVAAKLLKKFKGKMGGRKGAGSSRS
ncbi:hypothetical protein F5890DRAFT_86561 [Lentinula detonsa]|uniref:Uncharacterized protein n=1 Tax=Lentinula detonsa TaxID=2804962 RepID=A0AA38Q869_9AGAR|nr:hypothetical protein F5890DRAFT_86561 [Lentinula detonsa]